MKFVLRRTFEKTLLHARYLLPLIGLLGSAFSATATAELLYSYNDDLSDANPVHESSIEARSVYFFYRAESATQITFECCNWVSGPGSRLANITDSTVVQSGQGVLVDLSAKHSGSNLRAYVAVGNNIEESDFSISRSVDSRKAELQASGTVIASANGQVIENLRIDAGNGVRCAIEVKGFRDVVIRNVHITHQKRGICAKNAENIRIEHVHLVNTGAPESGPHCREGFENCLRDRNKRENPYLNMNISLFDSDNATIEFAELEKGSAGINVYSSDSVSAYDIRCLDVRGPSPLGNCIQFDHSNSGSIKNFYVKNWKETSNEHDVISFFASDNGTVSHGLIDGSYSIHGVGVISDRGSDYLTVTDVDFVRTTTGALAISTSRSYDTVGHHMFAKNNRVIDSSCETRFGTRPSSGGLLLIVHPASDYPEVEDFIYWNHCREHTTWCLHPSCRARAGGEGGSFDVREEFFELKEPLQLVFDWQDAQADVASLDTE